jgi:hypothetical protein
MHWAGSSTNRITAHTACSSMKRRVGDLLVH